MSGFKTTVKVDGMACGMCEAHVCDAIRGAIKTKKVTASHTKKIAEIITEEKPDDNVIKEAIEKTGYKVLGMDTEPYEKKGFLFFKK